MADLHRASYVCGRIVSCLPAHLVSQTFSASVLVQCVAITIFTLNQVRHVPSGGELCAATSPKANGGGGGDQGAGDKTWAVSPTPPPPPPPQPQVEVVLSEDEQKSLDIILGFTGGCLSVSVGMMMMMMMMTVIQTMTFHNSICHSTASV